MGYSEAQWHEWVSKERFANYEFLHQPRPPKKLTQNIRFPLTKKIDRRKHGQISLFRVYFVLRGVLYSQKHLGRRFQRREVVNPFLFVVLRTEDLLSLSAIIKG